MTPRKSSNLEKIYREAAKERSNAKKYLIDLIFRVTSLLRCFAVNLYRKSY